MEWEAVRLIAIACALVGVLGVLYAGCYAVAGMIARGCGDE